MSFREGKRKSGHGKWTKDKLCMYIITFILLDCVQQHYYYFTGMISVFVRSTAAAVEKIMIF